MIIVGDPHLGRTGDSIPKNGLPSRIYDTILRLREATDYAVKHEGSNDVILAGDVFDSEYPRAYVIDQLMSVFSYGKKLDVKFWVIPGNHDCGVQHHSLQYLRWMDNVVLIETPYVTEVGGVNVLFLPHMPRSEFEKALEGERTYMEYAVSQIPKGVDKIDLLIGHAHIRGAKNASDVEVEAGNALEFDPRNEVPFRLGVFGHIHKHQVIGKNIIYTGPMVTCSFDEAEIEKGFIHIPDSVWDWQFVQFQTPETAYKHITIDMVSKDAVTLSSTKIKKLASDKLLKITVYAKDQMQIDKYEITKAFNAYGTVVRFESVICNDIGEVSDDLADDVFDSVDYPKALQEYLESKKLKKNELETALRLGKEVVEEVLNAERAAS